MATVIQAHFVKGPAPGRATFGAILNKVFFATHNARVNIVLSIFRPSVITAAVLIRKSALDECGGLRAFGCYLAEDLHLGDELTRRGYKHVLGDKLAWQNPANTTVWDVFNRQIRWKRLRQTSVLYLTIFDPITECVVMGLLASMALHHVVDAPMGLVFSCNTLAWCLMDYILFRLLDVRFTFY